MVDPMTITALKLPTWDLDDGRIVLDARDEDTGVEWLLTKPVKGWDTAPAERLEQWQAASGHGLLDAEPTMDARLLVCEGVMRAPSEDVALATQRRWSSLSTRGPLVPLVVTEQDLTTRLMVRRSARAEFDWTSPTEAEFQLSLIAPDPRKYKATPETDSTLLPQSSGGLNWAAGSATRTNLATRPQGGSWTAFNGNGSVAYVASLNSPPALTNVKSGTTATCTVAGAFGAGHSVTGVTVGLYYTASLYVRPSVSRDVRIYMEWRDAGGALLVTNFMTTTAVPIGQWTRLQINRVAPANAASVVVSAVTQAGAVGETLDVTALLPEQATNGATAGNYFDGDTPGCTWNGAPQNSTSLNGTSGLDWASGLNWGVVLSSGVATLLNPGTAAAWPVFTIRGPVLNPSIIATDFGEVLKYTGSLAAGEFLVIDTHPLRRSVLLGGVASRRRYLTTTNWFAIPAESELRVSFGSETFDPAASLDIEWSPAWW